MSEKSKNIKRHLTLNSKTDNLTKIRKFVQKAAEDCEIDRETINKIVLATDEACSNVIKHAYKYAAQGKINVFINYTKSKFSVKIVDSGSHFDPETIDDPDIKQYYKKRKIGGLGMFLMKRLMDEVVYSELNDNRNQVVLVKYL